MKREKWEALIAEQKESGLTIADFCRMRGLNRKTFSYQKSVLKAQKPSADVQATVGDGLAPLKHRHVGRASADIQVHHPFAAGAALGVLSGGGVCHSDFRRVWPGL